jgi:hypothetical protein
MDREARGSLLEADATRILGYRPAVDLLLESRHTDERLWLELEISRADPVANHAKFASAHLMQPLSERDTFVSLVSNHVARGRANLAAHAIHLLRIAGLKAFQIPLLPELPLLSHLIQRDSPIPGPFSIQWFHHKTLNRNEESGYGLPSYCTSSASPMRAAT